MPMKSALFVFALSFLALGPAPRAAVAATASASFAVTATVQAGCRVSASSMGLGTYTGAAMNAAPAVAVNCTLPTPYNVGLSAEMASGATVATREMTGPGAALLGYALASNSQRAVNRGQILGTGTVAGTGNGSAQGLWVPGQISAGQFAAAGGYADTITVTVTY